MSPIPPPTVDELRREAAIADLLDLRESLEGNGVQMDRFECPNCEAELMLDRMERHRDAEGILCFTDLKVLVEDRGKAVSRENFITKVNELEHLAVMSERARAEEHHKRSQMQVERDEAIARLRQVQAEMEALYRTLTERQQMAPTSLQVPRDVISFGGDESRIREFSMEMKLTADGSDFVQKLTGTKAQLDLKSGKITKITDITET